MAINPRGSLMTTIRTEDDKEGSEVVASPDTPPVLPGKESEISAAHAPKHEQYHAEKPTTPDKPRRKQSDTEQGVRIAVAVTHSVGGILASAFGAGGLVQPVGNLEGQALDSAFGKA